MKNALQFMSKELGGKTSKYFAKSSGFSCRISPLRTQSYTSLMTDLHQDILQSAP